MKRRQFATSLLGLLLTIVLLAQALTWETPPMMAHGSDPEHGANGDKTLPIRLRARTFTPEPGIDPALENRELIETQGRIHVLVQFWSIPDENERASLQAAGLRLLSFIPHNAWLASIPARVDLQALPSTSVRWIGPLQPTDKMSPAIQAHGVGVWAVAQDGRVLLDLRFFDDVSADEAMQVIARHGGQVQEEIGDFHRYVAWFPADAVSALATKDTVMWIDSGPPPKVTLNDGARAATNVDAVQAGGLDGSGVDLGIWDGGKVDSHTDFSGRLTVVDMVATAEEHATHVAGTMAGDGSNSASQGGTALQWRGMAPAADIFSYDWNFNIIEHNGAINTYGIELSQNSWGYSVDEAEYDNCDLYGDYTLDSREYDDIVTGKYGEGIVVVFAAGNDRNDGDCGMSGGPDYVNYGNITPPGGTAKNVIVVGAVNSNDDSMTTFSDWGPVDDGRLKPDVVAPGCESTGEGYIHSTLLGNTYGAPGWCGTSMAAPVVSGISALLIEQYRTTFGQDPLPSSAKALLIHTAEDLSDGTSWYNPGPDYASGYGRVDAQVATDAIVAQKVLEDQASHGETTTYSIELSQTTSFLKTTLVWDDPPASLLADPKLINNLDLELIEPNGTTIHYPWVLDPAHPSNNATTGVDSVNNVEQVYVTDPATGIWTVLVKGTSVPQGPQHYSLVTSEAITTASSTAPIVTSITPNTGVNTGTVHITNLAGDNFNPGASVKLIKLSQSAIEAPNETVVSSNTITCDFDLTGATTGQWNVVVTNPDLQSGTLYNGFSVTAPPGDDHFIYLPAVLKNYGGSDTQVIQNGGFESGNTVWVQQSGSYTIIGQQYPRSGSWNAWFGGYNNANDRLYQTIDIPSGISSAKLTIYLYVYTTDSLSTPRDYFHVELQDSSGSSLDSFLWADNTLHASGWYVGTREWSDFSAHADATRRLFFQGSTNSSAHTNFFVDDVTLWTYCGSLPSVADEAEGSSDWTWKKVDASPIDGLVPPGTMGRKGR